MRHDQRNARVLAVAEVATHITAQRVTDGVAQLQAQRLHALDGPDKGDDGGRSSNTTSATERNAAEAYRLGLLLEDLRDAILGLEIAHNCVLRLAEEACRTRAFSAPPEAPPEVTVCKHGQAGKAGAIEWGDVTCDRTPVKMELCVAHYTAYYRYRKDNGRDTSKDFAA